MRILQLLPQVAALASLATTGVLTGCGSLPQYDSASALSRQPDVGGILKFAYNAPTPTTAWDTEPGASSGETVVDGFDGAKNHTFNSIALLQSLRRGDREDVAKYRGRSDQSASSWIPKDRARTYADSQTEHAYLSASLARLSTAAPVGQAQPSNVATVTEMPDFAQMPVGGPVVRPVDMRP